METNYEEDDDTHYCIKCHQTVNGLDNYVRHRQTGCRPSETKRIITPEPPNPAVSYPEILNADAFFSSLELQSSAKSKSQEQEKLKIERTGVNKRRRTTRRGDKYTETDVPSPKEKLMTLAPVVTDLDPTEQIGLPSLVGFPDIVQFTEKSSSNAKISTITNKTIEREKKPEDNPDWLNDSDDSDDSKANTDDVQSNSDDAYDYNQHDDGGSGYESTEDIGQDSYTDTDDPDDSEYPPQGPTGGKWKPGQLPHDHMVHDDDEDQEERDHDASQLPVHTGGKWKPEKTEEDEAEDDRECREDDDRESVTTSRSSRQPPPGHTRGKWIPGTSATTVVPSTELGTGYWCSPCGRKLASKLVYNRHLRSDLHARRCIQEIEGDTKLPRSIGPLLRKKCRTKRQRALALKRNAEIKKMVKEINPRKKTRNREKAVLQCEMCQARVRRPQLGKHLLSHYHCRVAGLNPGSPTARRFILENMGNVVRQCPFQCSGCHFYCNTEDTFLLHWRSSLHDCTRNTLDSSYICVCCDFSCTTDATMEKHLLSLEHRETVAMISGSVPIVIRRQRILLCDTCNRDFRYNFQLRLHSKETGHALSKTASDEYQCKIRCDLCPKVLRSQVSLQRHQLKCHKTSDVKDQTTTPYFCSFCSINFETAWDAVLHRRTTSHKQTVKEQKFGSNGVLSLQRDCGHCQAKHKNLIEHRQHLLQRHPDLCHKCPMCGEIFALSQDVTRHTKSGDCRKKITTINDQSSSSLNQRKCNICNFTTESESEFIFHQIIHSSALRPNCNHQIMTSVKYSCPICDKKFNKRTLKSHLRRHTGERPFACYKCHKSFAQRSTLRNHANICHSSFASMEQDQANEQLNKIRQRNYICLECNTAFYTKDNLRQHMLRHVGKSYKCGLPGCPTILRSATELKAHRALIHESAAATNRQFQCNECSYAAKTKTQLGRHHYTRHKTLTIDAQFACPNENCNFVTKLKSHLKRHVRLHTGSKPYRCPHCSYASNNIENLRKHILSTGLHPGKTIYECDKCKCYGTNFSKELRAHLLEKHFDEFPTPNHANIYVAEIFNVN